jgi:hypothetical protein
VRKWDKEYPEIRDPEESVTSSRIKTDVLEFAYVATNFTGQQRKNWMR